MQTTKGPAKIHMNVGCFIGNLIIKDNVVDLFIYNMFLISLSWYADKRWLTNYNTVWKVNKDLNTKYFNIFFNYILTPLDMYNGLSQVYYIKPEFRINASVHKRVKECVHIWHIDFKLGRKMTTKVLDFWVTVHGQNISNYAILIAILRICVSVPPIDCSDCRNYLLIFTFPLRVFKWTFRFEIWLIPSRTNRFKPHLHTRLLSGLTSSPSNIVACLLTFVRRWTRIAMTLSVEIWRFGFSKPYVMSDLIQNIWNTSKVRWKLKIDSWQVI